MDVIYYLKYYYSYLTSEFSAYPFVIKLTVTLVTLMVFILLISIIRLILINRKIQKFSKTKEKLSSLFYDKLRVIIYDKEDISVETLKETFEHDLSKVKNAQQKKALTELFSEMLYSGSNEDILNENNYLMVLNIFGIIDYWEKLVVSNSASKRQSALRILDDLKLGLSGSSILRSVYQKDNDLRKLARATLMEYDNNDPYKFLEDSFDNDFNSLDEVRVHYFLSKKSEEENLPQLFRWVKTSKNPAFKAFIVEQIGYFNQVESASLLVDLLDEEKDQLVICKTIEALGVLDYKQSEDKLISMYEMGSKPIQRSIIVSLSHFKTTKSLNVLEQSYHKTHDNDMKIALAYAISGFGKSGKDALSNLAENSSAFDKKIFAQVNYQ